MQHTSDAIVCNVTQRRRQQTERSQRSGRWVLICAGIIWRRVHSPLPGEAASILNDIVLSHIAGGGDLFTLSAAVRWTHRQVRGKPTP